MATGAEILVVDDDADIRAVVSFALGRAGYRTVEAPNGRAALEMVAQHRPALIVLDVLMPEMDGLEVCRSLRRACQTPIIFLSSRDDEIDRVLGLEMGGDDYVTKPFSPRELVARVRAVMRRLDVREAVDAGEAVIEVGSLRLDPQRFEVWWGQQGVALTVTEFGLLRTMMRRPGKVFTRDELLTGAYGDHTVVSDRTIDSHITRLRRKFEAIGASPIETVHGLGYRCGGCVG